MHDVRLKRARHFWILQILDYVAAATGCGEIDEPIAVQVGCKHAAQALAHCDYRIERAWRRGLLSCKREGPPNCRDKGHEDHIGQAISVDVGDREIVSLAGRRD